MYSWNSFGILSTALRNSSMAFPPLLSSAAITLIRSHLFIIYIIIIIFNENDAFDETCDSYLYFWINLRRAVATRSWEADKRVNMGYMLMSESSVEWDSNDIWGTENSFAVNWTSSFNSLGGEEFLSKSSLDQSYSSSAPIMTAMGLVSFDARWLVIRSRVLSMVSNLDLIPLFLLFIPISFDISNIQMKLSVFHQINILVHIFNSDLLSKCTYPIPTCAAISK